MRLLTHLLCISAIVLSVSAARAEDLIPYEAPGWKYMDVPHSDPLRSEFYRLTFDDSSWPVGQAAFGTIDGYCPLAATVHTSWPGASEMLLRRWFEADPDYPVIVHVAIDNDIVIYVNGVEIFSVIDGQCPFQDEFNVPVPPNLITGSNDLLAIRATDGLPPSLVDIRLEGQLPSGGVVIHVPGDQPTIQAGIDAAANGDTVLVAPGIYTGEGNLAVSFHGTNVVLTSEGGPSATLIESESGEAWLNITNGERPSISGFEVRHADAAIWITDASLKAGSWR